MEGPTRSGKAHYEEAGKTYDLKYNYNQTNQGYWVTPNPEVANRFFVTDLEKAEDIIINAHRVKRNVRS